MNSTIVKTVALLICSNIFMTFAWYAHLRHLSQKPWIVAAVVSWGIALFEYLLQVPANRIGHTQLQLGQLKILQEVITLSVFVPFAALYMKEPVRLNYLSAASATLLAVAVGEGIVRLARDPPGYFPINHREDSLYAEHAVRGYTLKPGAHHRYITPE